MVDLLQVGVITSTHGIKGEVKVFPTTDDPTRYSYLKDVILDTGKEKIDLKVSGVKYFKQYVIVKFKGINDINDIEKYKGSTLWVTRENAVPLEENEYFIADLIGLKVVTDEGEEFGELTDVMQTGANDVYVVETYKDKQEVLLPVIDECVLDVDLEKGIVTVHIMEGLLD
ncbi:MAG: 16S rRNA processing protein RimM [Lachnospiraceae bacterium]|nr:16S rRNA processing protein RimM [Lachnospiraceae bacterium]